MGEIRHGRYIKAVCIIPDAVAIVQWISQRFIDDIHKRKGVKQVMLDAFLYNVLEAFGSTQYVPDPRRRVQPFPVRYDFR